MPGRLLDVPVSLFLEDRVIRHTDRLGAAAGTSVQVRGRVPERGASADVTELARGEGGRAS